MTDSENGNSNVVHGHQVTWVEERKPTVEGIELTDLEKVAEALKGHDFVVDYQAADGKKSESRLVTNCSLKFKAGTSAIYLSGWDETRQAVRSFSFSRISRIRMVGP